MALLLLLGALGVRRKGARQPDRETQGCVGRGGRQRRVGETGEGQRKEKTTSDHRS